MKGKNRAVRRWGWALLVSLAFCFAAVLPAAAVPSHQAPYDTYAYSYEDGRELASTPGYVPSRVITGVDLGVGELKDPSDIFIDEIQRKIYLADTGNNRILATDMNFSDVRIFTGVLCDGEESAFSAPTGLFVDQNGLIYVADSGNGRVVRMTGDGVLDREYGRPVSEQFDETVEYKPKKVAVTRQGNIYIVAEGIFEGLIELDEQGEFQRYSGTISVKPSLWDLFWRRFSTREQIAAMEQFIPVTFENVDLDTDEEGFIYATSQSNNTGDASMVKRLNPGGTNVIRSSGSLTAQGDSGNLNVGRGTGLSLFNDVAYMGEGIFACTDKTRGRVFVYGSDSELLFAFAGRGSQMGNLTTPSALDNDGYRLMVLDSTNCSVTLYEPTDYGMTLINGVVSYESGEFDDARTYFNRAFQYNSNCEAAYLGIGKMQLRSGNYQDALTSFSLASNREYYSKALGMIRQEFMEKHFVGIFALLLGCVAVLAALVPVRRTWKRRHPPKEKAPGKTTAVGAWFDRLFSSLDHAFYCVFHPFKGFYELKYEKKGSVRASFVLLALYVLTMIVRSSMTGFVFRSSTSGSNPVWDGLIALLPVLFFCLINWCITTLMDGEGSLKYIFISVSYALVPLIVVQIPLTVLSNLLTASEAVFYTTIETVVMIYTVFLLLVGNMSVQNFTMAKTIAMALLTVLGIAVVVFILFLFFNLAFEIVGFISQIYKEIVFRM